MDIAVGLKQDDIALSTDGFLGQAIDHPVGFDDFAILGDLDLPNRGDYLIDIVVLNFGSGEIDWLLRRGRHISPHGQRQGRNATQQAAQGQSEDLPTGGVNTKCHKEKNQENQRIKSVFIVREMKG